MQTHFLTITARPSPDAAKPAQGDRTRAVQMGDALFVVTANGPDAAAVLDAFDPLEIESLRDRIGTLLQRGNAILAEMAERGGAVS